MKPLWIFDKKSRAYRNLTTGQYIGQKGMIALRDSYTDKMMDIVGGYAGDLVSQKVTEQEWMLAMRQTIKSTFADQYVLGRGGRKMMTQRDWGRVGQMVKVQYQYLQKFYHDVMTKDLTEAQIAVRAALYIESSTQAFEKGKSESFGGLVLPEYPGDGSQDCRARCRCHWQIQDAGDAWHATWVLEPSAVHCQTCLENSIKWAPLIIKKQFVTSSMAQRVNIIRGSRLDDVK